MKTGPGEEPRPYTAYDPHGVKAEMGTRPIRDRSRRRLAIVAALLVSLVVSLLPIAAIAQADDSPLEPLVLLEQITSGFPDRKTASYESGQFLSFAAAHLKEEGWFTSIATTTR